MMSDARRAYYDHEPAYRRIVARGGRGWDDLNGGGGGDSYAALEAFLESPRFGTLPKPVRTLDLGCGGGQGSIRLARRGCAVHGIDFAESAVALAQSNAAQANVNATFSVGDVLDVNAVEHARYDLVVDNHVLHCILEADDRRAFMATVHRTLCGGGILFSETMSAEGELDMTAHDIDPTTRQARNRTRFWTTQAELRELIESSGFEILAQERRPQSETPPPGEMIVTIARRG